jgi:hypothetical protein
MDSRRERIRRDPEVQTALIASVVMLLRVAVLLAVTTASRRPIIAPICGALLLQKPLPDALVAAPRDPEIDDKNDGERGNKNRDFRQIRSTIG